jgi:hypothetical protein
MEYKAIGKNEKIMILQEASEIYRNINTGFEVPNCDVVQVMLCSIPERRVVSFPLLLLR